MRKIVISFLLPFLLLISSSVFSQSIYKFSSRQDKFPYELEEFMSQRIDKSKKKDLKVFMEQFSLFWNGDSLTQAQKKEVIIDANLMSKQRMRPFPDFEEYVSTIMNLARDSVAYKQFDNWMQSLQPLLKSKNKRRFFKYLTKSKEIFIDKDLFRSSTFNWKVSKLDFEIIVESRLPYFVFKTIDMSCYTNGDTGYIFQTQGKLDVIKETWEGTGGIVDWRRANLDTAKVYVKMKNYKIRLTSGKYFADSVVLHDHRRFGFGILGRLSEQVFTATPKVPVYPSFRSYQVDLTINDIYRDVDYYGGYSLKGSKIIGSGDKNHKAYFIFKRNGKRFVWAGSESFSIYPDRIQSDRVNVIIYLDEDSIYHPGLSITYYDKKRILSVFRLDKGLSMAPFYDTYHQLDIYTEAMFWNLDKDYIDLKMIQQEGSKSQAYFESLSYYSKGRYDRMQGIDRFNPVNLVYNYITEQGFNEFHVDDFARRANLSPTNARVLLMRLATQGFLIYDINDDYCIAKDRVSEFIHANRGKIDYDVIQFSSTVMGKPNASINLLNNDLIIQGVNRIFLSDSQKVYITPKNQRVVVQKNRDFTFDGLINAGRFNLYARECQFEYDKFRLDLPIIDSLSFSVKSFEANKWGEHRLVAVKTVIQDFKGEILVDDPGNKSGLKDFPEYPTLTSKTHSSVYYDKPSIFNGIYKKDKFYYRLDAFSIDSLDNFQTEGLEFAGYLVSDGIFPDIDEPLKVQPDYSLGFVRETGPAGYNIYGNKGKYVSKISMSNKGLRGDGELHYLTSISKSKDFVFFPDSTRADLDSYVLEERTSGVEYPSVVAENVKMHWQPYKDIMRIQDYKPDFPLRMYKEEGQLSGRLFLTPNSLTGDGVSTINDAEITAKLFKFKNTFYNTDTCSFKLKKFVDASLGMGGLEDDAEDAIATDDFKARIDFKERKGEFEANGSSKRVDFPENNYYCYMDQFVWYMDKDELELSSKAKQEAGFDKLSDKEKIDVDIQGSEFISTHPQQDSLRFIAQRAIFNRRKAKIHAYGVEHIRVADAAIIPDKKELKIFRKAEIEELSDAKIIANAVSKYYELYNATVNIKSRSEYNGRALYDFKDETGAVSNIYFTNIYADTTGTTIGEGKIEESAKFALSPAFDFYGNTRLIANNKNLYFSGGTRIHYDCDTLARQWINFTAFIDPAAVKIPVNQEIKSTTNNDLFAGIYQNKRGNDVLYAFFDPLTSSERNAIASATGVLTYDKVSQEYRISTEDKLTQLDLSDDFLSLSKRDCDMRAEGRITLGMNPGPVTMDAFGNARHYLAIDSTTARVCIPLNFHFSEKALELMVSDMNNQMDADGVNLDSRPFNLALGNIFGEEEAQKLRTEITTQGNAFRRVPKELQRTLVISDVEMYYNSRKRSFLSDGKIGIASSGKTQINKYFDGVIEIENKGTYLEFRIVIEVGGNYYFFDYNSSTGYMQTFSNNKEFVTIIDETKADDRKMKSKEEGKTIKYQYKSTTAVSYKKFTRTLERYK